MLFSRCSLRAIVAAVFAGCLTLAAPLACAEAKTLIFFLPDSPPQGIKTADSPRGIMHDVAVEAARRAGYQAETGFIPWPRTLDEVKYGENLLIAGLSRVPSREDSFTWIYPVFSLSRVFVTTGPVINSYEEGREKLGRIAVHYGSMEKTMLLAGGFAANQLSFITTNTPLLDFLVRGRVDALYRPLIEIKWLLRGRSDLRRLVIGQPMQSTDQYIACSLRCDPAIVEGLQTAPKSMQADGAIDRIMKAYE